MALPVLSGTINANKELDGAAFPSILLGQVTFTDGTTLNMSTHPLNTAEGGFQYSATDYLARVKSYQLDPTQAMSDFGIDIIPNARIELLDPDRYIYSNYEATKGFCGASIKLLMILWDPDTGAYSSDSSSTFVGICSSPSQITPEGMTITAASRLNMARVFLPKLRIQKRCPNNFPTTLAQRQDGADNAFSIFYQCGYSPDATGGNARGNYVTGTTPYTKCNYTKSDCQLRGMYSTDSTSRATGRFRGIQWMPPGTWRSKSYLQGKTITGYSSQNEAVYNDFIPMGYGTQMLLTAPVTSIIGEANSTRFEVLLCDGDVGATGVIKVIVNDVAIAQNNPADVLLTWYSSNTGSRQGRPTSDGGFDSNGDPHGSIACIEIVVPVQLQASTGAPTVGVVLQFPQIPIPNAGAPSTWPLQYSTNPAYILLDLLHRANWGYSDIDTSTFITAAAVCDATINYVNNVGATVSHARYRASFALHEKRTAADVIGALRRSFNAILVPNSKTGLLQLFIEQTLADQQSAPVAGSNYNTGVASVNAANSAATGYAAYLFDESNVIKNSLRITVQPLSSLVNRVSFPFQDQENQYQQDSISVVDTAAILNAGNQEIPTDLNVIGIDNFDQAIRICNLFLGKQLRGNPRNDAGGSMVVEFTTTQKASHLRLGHIVLFTWQQLSLTKQTFRITSLQPTQNANRWIVRMQWHNDVWHTDPYGQDAGPFNNMRPKRNRPPYPWQGDAVLYYPNGAAAPAQSTFGMNINYSTDASGLAGLQLAISGYPPFNSGFSPVGPPLIPLQGTSASTGGTIPPGNYVVALCSVDSANKISTISHMCMVFVPAGTNTNTITIPNIKWPSGAVSYLAYIGTNELNLLQSINTTPTGVPASVTLTQPGGRGAPPDDIFDHLRIRAKLGFHLGVGAFAAAAVSGNTVTCSGAAWTTNQWAGRQLSILARGPNNAATDVAMTYMTITSNTATVLTVSVADQSPVPPLTYYISVGDTLVIRTKPDTFTATTIGDSQFANSTPGSSASGLAVNAEVGRLVRILSGTGAGTSPMQIISNTATVLTVGGKFPITPDATSVFIIENQGWALDVTTDRFVSQAILPAFGPVSIPVIGSYDLTNFGGRQLIVTATTETAGKQGSPDHIAAVRDCYVIGSQGTRTVTAHSTVTPTDGTVRVDTSAGPVTVTLPASGTMPNQQITVVKVTADANAVTISGAASGSASLATQWAVGRYKSNP